MRKPLFVVNKTKLEFISSKFSPLPRLTSWSRMNGRNGTAIKGLSLRLVIRVSQTGVSFWHCGSLFTLQPIPYLRYDTVRVRPQLWLCYESANGKKTSRILYVHITIEVYFLTCRHYSSNCDLFRLERSRNFLRGQRRKQRHSTER